MNLWDRIMELANEGKVGEALIHNLIDVAYARGVVDGLTGKAQPGDTKDMILPRVKEIINASGVGLSNVYDDSGGNDAGVQ